MKKTILTSVLLFGLSLFLLPLKATADGGIMPPPNYWMTETDQKAVIVSENGTETMILSTSFEGNAKDFAWIIPTPSKPIVSRGVLNIFEALDEFTSTPTPSPGIVYDRLSLGVAEQAKPSVNVIEQKKIGYYDVAVLEADDSESLYQWLRENNYNYPDYGKLILDSYIENGWFFTAAKINPENAEIAGGDLRRGTITPLKLVFSSEKIVYPLKISSVTTDNPQNIPGEIEPVVSSDGSTETAKEIVSVPPIYPGRYVGIMLYVFADHKKQADNFTTSYAGWVDKNKIENLALDDNGDSWYTPQAKKMYLTKLYQRTSPVNMKNDVFLTNTKDNERIPPSQFWYSFFLTLFLILIFALSPFVLIYLIFALLFIFLKSKTVKIASLFVQGLITLAGVFILLSLLFAMFSSYYESGLIEVIISSSIIITAMIIGIVLELVIGKRKKIL